MKRSEINALIRDAARFFGEHHWALPPEPRWDVTDFGLGDWRNFGLVLVNLAEEPEYCEKLMYARSGMITPAHCHRRKKEDIICRNGTLQIRVWPGHPDHCGNATVLLPINGAALSVEAGAILRLEAGWRVTLVPGIFHEFRPESDECIIGEVSTANDDANDNFFVNLAIGRYPGIEEDEEPLLRLLSDRVR